MTPHIRTFTGRLADLTRPGHEAIDLRDIARALSQINRFTGHTCRPYTVAEHSVLVSYFSGDDALAGLLHDAPEAYLGDVSSPLKALLPEYQAIEQRWAAAIEQRYGLPPQSEQVHRADALALHAEFVVLMKNAETGGELEAESEKARLAKFCWMLRNPPGAGNKYWEQAFTARFHELMSERYQRLLDQDHARAFPAERRD